MLTIFNPLLGEFDLNSGVDPEDGGDQSQQQQPPRQEHDVCQEKTKRMGEIVSFHFISRTDSGSRFCRFSCEEPKVEAEQVCGGGRPCCKYVSNG